MTTDEDRIKAAMISKFEEMTPAQIADEVIYLVEKGVKAAIAATEKLMIEKIEKARDEVLKGLT